MKTVRIKINKNIPGHGKGTLVSIPVDDVGIPTEKFWRDRLRDAETDSCVEIDKTKSKSKVKNEEKSK